MLGTASSPRSRPNLLRRSGRPRFRIVDAAPSSEFADPVAQAADAPQAESTSEVVVIGGVLQAPEREPLPSESAAAESEPSEGEEMSEVARSVSAIACNYEACFAVAPPSPKSARLDTERAPEEEEVIALEQLEEFAKEFKRRRIKLGCTQADVSAAICERFQYDFSQTTVSRFEALNLSFKNMLKLKPVLSKWLHDAETAVTCQTGPSEYALPVEPRKRKRRTRLDASLRAELESCFQLNARPTARDMTIIADSLGQERELVRIWFCNRRQKEKRELEQEEEAGADTAIVFTDESAAHADAADAAAVDHA